MFSFLIRDSVMTLRSHHCHKRECYYYSLRGLLLVAMVLLSLVTVLVFFQADVLASLGAADQRKLLLSSTSNNKPTREVRQIHSRQVEAVFDGGELKGSAAKQQQEQPTTTMAALAQSTRAKRLPQAIIIGSRKGGTRALLKFLEVNRAIRAAHREIHFFDKAHNYKRGLGWYRDQMPESSQDEITIEKSPAYFVTQGVPERVRAMNSSIKLVLILRDPVTRLISDYSQLVANRIRDGIRGSASSGGKGGGKEDDEPVGAPPAASDDADDDEDSEDDDYGNDAADGQRPAPIDGVNQTELAWREAQTAFEDYVLRPDGGIDDQRRAVRIGMYPVYLERWRAFFPASQFHFVDGDNLIKRPHEELNRVESFLGLQPSIGPESFVFNPRKGFYCLARTGAGAASATVGSPAADSASAKIIARRRIDDDNDIQSSSLSSHRSTSKIAKEGRRQVVEQTTTTTSAQVCLSRSKGRRHVAVKKELVNELEQFYAPYNEYLYSLVGKNFNWSARKGADS